jgi:hypothetical protein
MPHPTYIWILLFVAFLFFLFEGLGITYGRLSFRWLGVAFLVAAFFLRP